MEGLKFFLKHIPQSELIYPPMVNIINQTIADIKQRMELRKKMNATSKTKVTNSEIFTLISKANIYKGSALLSEGPFVRI